MLSHSRRVIANFFLHINRTKKFRNPVYSFEQIELLNLNLALKK